MTDVLRLFVNICLLRTGPEAVPTQAWFLGALVAALVSVDVFLMHLARPDVATTVSLNLALIGVAVSAAVTWFVLHVRHFESRFPATFGAIAGTKLLIGGLLWLLYSIASGVVLQSASTALTLWSIVVTGFILHRALSCRLALGIAVSVATAAIAFVIMLTVLATLV